MRIRRLVAALLAAGVLGSGAYGLAQSRTPVVPAPPVGATAAAQPATTLPDFTRIVRANGAAVVNIQVTRAAAPAQGESPDGTDPFRWFFRNFPGPREPQSRGQGRGVGSGFIVDPDGVVLTNAHVVAGAGEVTVRLSDRREFKARVVGTDRQTDVAVLKIDAKGLPAVRIGQAREVSVGQWVVAIGSPYGLENTVTAGIVSATSRALPSEGYVPFIQTDVAVNPGNSGGPLFNLAGEVVGINSQIYSRTGGWKGLSFAIPIDVAVKVKDQLLAHGTVTRARLGIGIQEVDHALARSFGLDEPRGAVITSVEDAGPAAAAGLKSGDVVLSIDGQPILHTIDLARTVAERRPGETVKLEIWRERRARTIGATLGRQVEKTAVAVGDAGGQGPQLGLTVRAMSATERGERGLEAGLVVESVEGPAARAGIEAGDIILAINGTPVREFEQLRRLVRDAHASVALLVQRGDARLFVPIELARG